MSNDMPGTSSRRTSPKGPIKLGIEGLDGDRILTAREVATLVRIPVETVARHLRDGSLKGFRTGTKGQPRWRIRLTHVYEAFPGLQQVIEGPPPSTTVSEYELQEGEYELGPDGLKPS